MPGLPEVPTCCAQRWLVPLDRELLREARKDAGLSQERLAEAAGLSYSTVRKLERRADPRCHFRTRARLAKAMGIHPSEITAAIDGWTMQ